jgi:hypothetical protein
LWLLNKKWTIGEHSIIKLLLKYPLFVTDILKTIEKNFSFTD